MSNHPDDFEDTVFTPMLVCPACAADVEYVEVEPVEENDDLGRCPDCGVASPTDEWV